MKAKTVEKAQDVANSTLSSKVESFAERVARICGDSDSAEGHSDSSRDISEVSAFGNWNNFGNR